MELVELRQRHPITAQMVATPVFLAAQRMVVAMVAAQSALAIQSLALVVVVVVAIILLVAPALAWVMLVATLTLQTQLALAVVVVVVASRQPALMATRLRMVALARRLGLRGCHPLMA